MKALAANHGVASWRVWLQVKPIPRISQGLLLIVSTACSQFPDSKIDGRCFDVRVTVCDRACTFFFFPCPLLLLSAPAALIYSRAHPQKKDEVKLATTRAAFGVLTSVATAGQRLHLLRHWWLPGAVGCLSAEHHLSHDLLAREVPAGLELCPVNTATY